MLINNAHPNTSGEVEFTTAREALETTRENSAAIRQGFAEIRTFDLVYVFESDGAFDQQNY